MTFLKIPELLEIGDIPFSSPNQKPNRSEALEYYRKVAEHYSLDVRQYERVDRVDGSDGDFRVHTTDRFGHTHCHRSQKLVIATGYYDLPNYMNIPGEELPKVMHYYREPHPYYDNDVLVIGGKNSAAIAALELWRHGARVMLVHRGPAMHKNVKYWILPDIENRIRNQEITAFFDSRITEIGEDYVVVKTPDRSIRLDNDFVFALTGYHPDFDFLQSLGIELSAEQCRPVCYPEPLESNVTGIYVADL